MFKVSKLNDLLNFEVNVQMLPLEIHKYENGVKSVNVFETPDFLITGNDNSCDYSLSFRFNKPIEKLYDIELNTSVDIKEYVDQGSFYFGINGSCDLDVAVVGKIHRIISKTIIIVGSFVSSDDYSGKFEIEFNLDDYFNKDRKSDM